MAVALLAVAALASSLSTHAPSADPSWTRVAANSPITLRACNHTHDKVLVAGSWMPGGGDTWLNKGWMPVNPGACRDVFSTPNRTFYARAEVAGHSDQSWGSDIAQCVEYPGPYNFETKSSDTTCPEGEPAQFSTFHSDGRSVYVWNLNP